MCLNLFQQGTSKEEIASLSLEGFLTPTLLEEAEALAPLVKEELEAPALQRPLGPLSWVELSKYFYYYK